MKLTHDTRTITLGLLTISACLLGTVILLVNSNPAVADSSESRAEPWIMCVGKIGSNTDVLYVIDQESQRLHCYGADVNRKAIDLAPSAVVDLKVVFESDMAAESR